MTGIAPQNPKWNVRERERVTRSPRGLSEIHKLSGGSRGALGDTQTFRGWASNLHVNQKMFSLALRANDLPSTTFRGVGQ